MSIRDHVRKLRPVPYTPPEDKLQYFFERVDTTLNASITELFPAIAFNLKFKPSSVEDFKKVSLSQIQKILKKKLLRYKDLTLQSW